MKISRGSKTVVRDRQIGTEMKEENRASSVTDGGAIRQRVWKLTERMKQSRRGVTVSRAASKGRKSSILDALDKYTDEPSVATADTRSPFFDYMNSSVASIASSIGAPVRAQRAPTTARKTNPSLDLSSHKSKQQIGSVKLDSSNSAPDEQWARFKLLGRVGLGEIKVSDKVKQLIERNVGILHLALKNIVALRTGEETRSRSAFVESLDLRTGHVLDEVLATIELPTEFCQFKRDPKTIELDPSVFSQLQDYVTAISSMYRDNDFHDFEHASHVLKGVHSLLKVVETPDGNDHTDIRYITTDPWTQFALLFSALVHDVDHTGVSNAQLIKEKSHVAGAYKNKSVAEQNSIELAWNLLMEPSYKKLRRCIFTTPAELSRFRGLVVTAIMATDIADKELAALRKGRAAEALENNEPSHEASTETIRRKATFVLETLIQAADVSHTMQEFKIYKKWNRNLYREMYTAFKDGRAENDPTDTWFKSDIGFFDFYIIPLAKKLRLCGILEKSSAEWINGAILNRNAWDAMGESIVAEYAREVKREENLSAEEFDLDSSSESSSAGE
jgi:hypothetical protein